MRISSARPRVLDSLISGDRLPLTAGEKGLGYRADISPTVSCSPLRGPA